MTDYFSSEVPQSPWIIEGIAREQQITTLSGGFNRGKSPLMRDWAIHALTGIDWCGRRCQKRPIVLFDFETPEDEFRRSIYHGCRQLNLPMPLIPDQLIPYLARGAKGNPWTQALNIAWKSSKRLECLLALLDSAMQKHPNALLMIDPLDIMFRLDSMSKTAILDTFGTIRDRLSVYTQSGLITTLNVRKSDRRGERPDLLTQPHLWLEETSGLLDLMNRCDIRLGIDHYKNDQRILNGAVRGGSADPIVIKSVVTGYTKSEEPIFGGWERVIPDDDPRFLFSEKQAEYWEMLPSRFKYIDVVPSLIPKSSFSRLFHRAESLGLLNQTALGVYEKQTCLPGHSLEPRPKVM